jgi:hypothetical protein
MPKIKGKKEALSNKDVSLRVFRAERKKGEYPILCILLYFYSRILL